MTFASIMADKELPKPLRRASLKPLPARSSSLIRSNEMTLPSTAAPIVRTKPAKPGKVRTAFKPAKTPKIKSITRNRPTVSNPPNIGP